ncbi:hypothetical protein GCM10010191_75360 [Actinomadura vinacea]|uniref:Mce-associated membrane protein n=1 Tax=Actinomadura vinacea TaxID=115336 RepID=A0ABN3K5H5_9ACTN
MTRGRTNADNAERRAAEAKEKARRAAELAELAEQAAKEAAEAAAALETDEPEPEDDEPTAEKTKSVVSRAAAKPELVKPEPEPDAEPEPETKAKAEPVPDPESEPDTDLDSKAGTESDAEPETEDGAEDEAELEDEAEAEDGSEKDADGADDDGKAVKKKAAKVGAGRRAFGRPRVSVPGGGLRGLVPLGLVAVLAATGVGWMWMKKSEMDATETATRQATYAATQAAQSISSYDYRTVDADMRKATAYATGGFRKQFETQAERVRTLAPQQQAMVTGTAVKTAVEDISPESGTVLVFLNQQTVKNSEKGEAQRLPSQFTLRLAMTKVGDRWLVSKVEVV